jgi:hypothetical protein
MTKKFAVLDPTTGGYEFSDTETGRDTLIAQLALKFYKSHTHDVFYSVVDTDENGVETWTTPSGADAYNPNTVHPTFIDEMNNQEAV